LPIISSFILHPFKIRLHPFELARLRTYPQHTRAWLPLLRSRPGGVHRHYVVRSPKSDNLSKHLRSAMPIWRCWITAHQTISKSLERFWS